MLVQGLVLSPSAGYPRYATGDILIKKVQKLPKTGESAPRPSIVSGGWGLCSQTLIVWP